MITLKTLQWDNCFSYGKGNILELNSCNLTQLVGTNGMGKSSVPLIIEEVLFNKNSKGIKKQEIQNRFINDGYTINLTFEVDNDQYEIDVKRKATIKCKLWKNGEDISSHTATNTYKTVQELLGLDFKTFTQLVYQNTNTSLAFLTATDTNRKKFLIDLLKLTEYVDYFDVFKDAAREVILEINSLNSKSDTIVKWLNENKLESVDILPIKDLPKVSSVDEERLQQLRNDFEKISDKNKKIIDNNSNVELLQRLASNPDRLLIGETVDIEAKSQKLGIYSARVSDSQAHLSKLSKLKGQCPTCEEYIDEDKVKRLKDQYYEEIVESNDILEGLEIKIREAKKNNERMHRRDTLQKQFEEVMGQVDNKLPSQIFDKEEVSSQIATLSSKIQGLQERVREIAEENNKATQHNTRLEIIQEQTANFEGELEEIVEALGKVEDRSTH